MRSTCRMKCLCEESCRSRSRWSRCSLSVSKNSFCLLMSVARMREPSCCSMSCLQGRGGSSEPKNQTLGIGLFWVVLAHFYFTKKSVWEEKILTKCLMYN